MLNGDYNLVTTRDGSPSLEWLGPEGYTACMHSRVGAFAETEYVYLPVLEKTLGLAPEPKFISVGLGMGYNEIMWAGFCAKKNLTSHLDTYERDEFLSQQFLRWLEDQSGILALSYDDISTRYENYFKLPVGTIRAELRRNYVAKTWRIFGELTSTSKFDHKFNGMFFDPFGARGNPDLWTTEFLEGFIEKAAAEKCVFSTYAATGDLKRQLKQNGFQLEPRLGFAHKRESVFAIR